MYNPNLTRRQNRRLERMLHIAILIFFAILMTCTILTTRWVSELKTMTTDSLNVANEINVTVEELKYSEPNTAEDLIVYYSEFMPVEYCIFTVNTAEEYNVDPREIFAMIERESSFNPDAISSTGDYGLMQINKSNLPYLKESLGTTNLLDPYQNIEAGIYWYSGIKANNHGSIEKDLMVYNMGSRGASRQWDKGIYSTNYSKDIVEKMLET